MTAYVRNELDWDNLHFNVEMRTLNHRYRDIVLKLPQKLLPLEENIKRLIEEFITRGRVECTLKITGDMEELPALSINWEAARTYYSLLEELKTGLGLGGAITLDMFLGAKDIFTTGVEEGNIEEFWQPAKQVLQEALVDIKAMRQQEGENLRADMKNRLQHIAILSGKTEERIPEVVENYRQRLKQRIEELTGSEIDEARLAQEVVLFAERSDITEESVRLGIHLQKFKELLQKDEPVGRKLDFLLQEMHREANTIGVKANNTFISQEVVEIKTELEKIRQQVQNVE
jgi:uncharacterized protein (TIGR00255 family)